MPQDQVYPSYCEVAVFVRLFFLFTFMSLAEIFVLIQVGSFLGAGWTIALILITAFVGASLVRSQGLQTAATVQQRLDAGEMPGRQIIEALMLVIAGVLLVTPGFITDTLGLLVLNPSSRGWIADQVLKRVKVHQMNQEQGFGAQYQSGASQDTVHDPFERPSPLNPNKPERPRHGTTIDGDFERKD